MDSFSKFLVEHSYIKKEELLKGFIDFSESTPSIHKVISDHKLLSPDDHLNIIFEQQKTHLDFLETLKKSNLWSKDIDEKIKEVYSLQNSLHHKLVETNAITLEKLTSALDEFIADADHEPLESKNEIEDKTALEEPKDAEVGNNFEKHQSNQASTMPYSESIDSNLSLQMLEIFNSRSRERIISRFKNWQENGMNDKDSMLSDIHELNGASQFVQAKLSIILTEKLIHFFSSSEEALIMKKLPIAQKIVKMCFKLAESIGENHSEAKFYDSHSAETKALLESIA